jgi:hypothetical protein
MVESIHKLKRRMPVLALDDLQDICNTSTRRFLAKDVQTCFETRDSDLSRDIVGETYEQNVEVLRQQLAVISVVADSLREGAFPVKCPVAYRHNTQMGMATDAFLAAFSDYTESGDSDSQRVHRRSA